MNMALICMGRLKEKYWRDAAGEYAKRLGAYCSLEIAEIKESPLRTNPSAADEEAVCSLLSFRNVVSDISTSIASKICFRSLILYSFRRSASTISSIWSVIASSISIEEELFV